jgi:hypothetical protein
MPPMRPHDLQLIATRVPGESASALRLAWAERPTTVPKRLSRNSDDGFVPSGAPQQRGQPGSLPRFGKNPVGFDLPGELSKKRQAASGTPVRLRVPRLNLETVQVQRLDRELDRLESYARARARKGDPLDGEQQKRVATRMVEVGAALLSARGTQVSAYLEANGAMGLEIDRRGPGSLNRTARGC